MKKYLLIIGYLCSFLSLHGQIASLDEDILLFESDESSIDKGWPDCQEIETLKVFKTENEFFFEWDQELDQDYPEYELMFKEGGKTSTSLQKRNIAYNSFVLTKDNVKPNVEYEFKVRRRCYDNQGEEIYSDWTDVQFMSRQICDCNSSILPKYKIEGSCLALNWTQPCEDQPENAYVRVTLLAPANTPQVVEFNIDEFQFDYDISEITGDIKKIGFNYYPGGEVFCTVEYAVHDGTIEGCGAAPPEANCGDEYTNPEVTNETDINSLSIGNIITIANIPIVLTSVTKSGTTFSGDGLLATPFVTQAIEVSFAGISVNTDKQVYEGTINGVEGDPSNYPGFVVDPDTISIGGEICLPSPPPEGENAGGFDEETGLNDRGFNEDGIFVATGLPYDDKGFDINGFYNGTDSLFDDNGCDMNGYDEDGNLCQGNADSAIVNDFIDSVSVNLSVDIEGLLDNMEQTARDSLAALGCSNIRASMRTMIDQLQFDSTYIIGTDSEYIKQGMSDEFTSEPQPLAFNSSTRSQQVKDLESLHIELYKCDKLSTIYQRILSYLEEADPNVILTEVEISLQGLTRFQVEDFLANPGNFTIWLTTQIANIINEATGLVDYNVEKSPTQNTQIAPAAYDRSSAYYGVASTGSMTNFSPATMAEMKAERLWLFNQGYRNIKKLSRGYYLEELHRQMMMANGIDDLTTQLPVKLNNIIDGVNYDIFIDNLVLKPDGAELDAYFVFIDPNSGKRIVLEGHNINFGTGGLIGETKLSIGTAVEIRLSNAAKLIINPTEETYVSWDCEGFKSISLDLSIELCRNLIVPLDATTLLPLPEEERYKVDVEVTLTNWSDFYLALNDNDLVPFAIAGHEDFKWTLKNMVIDFSDYKSSGSAEMPPEYVSPFYNNGTFDDEWRGFYMGELSVVLPEDLVSSSENLKIGVQNVVIDDGGVSGVIFAENVIEMEAGDMGGWPFSIEDMNILVVRNKIKGGGFGGKVNVPILKGNMDYTASIYTNNRYEFTVSPLEKDSIDMMLAEVVIAPNSMIEVKYENSEFTAKATLHGEVLVSTGEGKAIEIDFPTITFNNLQLSNQAPYFSAGSWGMENNFSAEFYGFGINLKNIKGYNPDNDHEKFAVAVDLDLSLNKGIDINASGAVDIVGKLHFDSKGRQRWKYEKLIVNKFGIDCTFSAGHIKGQLETFDEAPKEGVPDTEKTKYGKGFQGFVDMKFKGVGQIAAVGIFGRTRHGHTEEYKYFMVDALAKSDAAGIPLAPIPLDITGFAGGVSYHMNRDLSTMDMDGPLSTTLPEIGESLSGVKYEPDFTKGIGLRAGAFMKTTGSEKVFNAFVSFEILFNSQAGGGGINEIAFTGVGQMMSLVSLGEVPLGGAVDSKPEGVETTITLNLVMKYNFNEKEFHGTFYTFVNSPGDIIKGIGDQGKAIDAEVHFAADKWYVYIGTPEKRCGLMISIPQLGSYKLDAYIDIGSEVPDMAELPSEISEIAGEIDDNASFRNSGAGFVFGAALTLDASMDFGFWGSASATAKLGFDLMMRNYNGSHCAGSQDEIGFDGWYATGQIYAFVKGELKILGATVMEAGIAAVLQGQMPNPFYAKGTLVAKYKNVYGVNKTKYIDVEFGEKCTLETDDPNDFGMTVISHLNVSNAAADIPVDFTPELYLNLPLDKEMTVGGKKYKAKLNSIKLESAILGNLSVTLDYKDDKTRVLANTADFYSNDDITFTVKVDVYKNGTIVGSEEKNVTFSTGKAYNVIKPSNVEYSYPTQGMYNYYPEEYNQHKGFLKLKNNMPDLFFNIPSDVDQKIRIRRYNGTSYIFDYEYDPVNQTMSWPMDPEMFQGNIAYTLELVRLQKGTYEEFTPGTGVDFIEVVNGVGSLSMIGLGNLNSGGGVQNVTTENQVTEEVFFKMYFRVSEYNTFEDKLDGSISSTDNYVNKILRAQVNGELFGPEEIGSGEANLVSLMARTYTKTSSSNNQWFKDVNNDLYTSDLPLDMINCPMTIYLEDEDGFTPLNEAANLHSSKAGDLIVNHDKYLYGWSNATGNIYQELRYSVPKLVNSHINNVQEGIDHCIAYLTEEGHSVNQAMTPKVVSLKNLEFTNPPAGDYKIRLDYSLPNGIKTSSVNWTLKI